MTPEDKVEKLEECINRLTDAMDVLSEIDADDEEDEENIAIIYWAINDIQCDIIKHIKGLK